MVSEKKIFFYVFSYYKSMEANDPRGVANLDPRGMIGRIYVEYHLQHCYILNIQALGLVDLEKKIFKCFCHYKPMADNDAPGLWPIWTPGSRLAGIIKGLTKHCFTQNIKALGLMVSEKKIFFTFFSYYKSYGGQWPPGRGQPGPQGHDWQDLWRVLLNVATY